MLHKVVVSARLHSDYDVVFFVVEEFIQRYQLSPESVVSGMPRSWSEISGKYNGMFFMQYFIQKE